MLEVPHPRPRVGISACLLGERVRWDGGHKLDRTLLEQLGSDVEWVPVCPEVELGLGAPREPMRLEQSGAGTRLVTAETRRDLTESMRAWARQKVEALAAENLSGFVLKSRSPSCGLGSVPLFDSPGEVALLASGLFAEALSRRFPDLPVAEEAELVEPRMRSLFLARVHERFVRMPADR